MPSVQPQKGGSHLSKFLGIKIRKPFMMTSTLMKPQTTSSVQTNLSGASTCSSSHTSSKLKQSNSTASCNLSNKSGDNDAVVQVLDLMHFKTSPCKIQGLHNPKKCLYFHEKNTKDRRRPPNSYLSEMCSYYTTNGVLSSKKECP